MRHLTKILCVATLILSVPKAASAFGCCGSGENSAGHIALETLVTLTGIGIGSAAIYYSNEERENHHEKSEPSALTATVMNSIGTGAMTLGLIADLIGRLGYSDNAEGLKYTSGVASLLYLIGTADYLGSMIASAIAFHRHDTEAAEGAIGLSTGALAISALPAGLATYRHIQLVRSGAAQEN